MVIGERRELRQIWKGKGRKRGKVKGMEREGEKKANRKGLNCRELKESIRDEKMYFKFVMNNKFVNNKRFGGMLPLCFFI